MAKVKDFSQTQFKKRMAMLKDAKLALIFVCITCLNAAFILYMTCNVFNFVNTCEIFVVSGASMYPTINAGSTDDKLIVDVTATPSVNDVIMFSIVKDGAIIDVTKRLIAVGGDKITAVRENVGGDDYCYYLQKISRGTTVPFKLQEDYVVDKSSLKRTYEKFQVLYTKSDIQIEVIDGQKYIVIPEGFVFFLGDNRDVSYDCSNFGPVRENGYCGKVVYLITNQKYKDLYSILYALGFLKSNI